LELVLIAFITFIKSFSIWIYIFCALGITFGIKMLFDARRLSRTTLFSLDQERAVDTTSRGLFLIAIMAAIIFVLTVVVVIVSPLVPQAEPPIARGVSPTIANIFPTIAATPSLPSSPQPVSKVTETVFATATSVPLPVWTFTPSPSATSGASPAAPRPTSGPASSFLAAPKLVYERNKDPIFDGVVVTGGGEATTRNSLIFKWDWVCDQCVLAANDKFLVNVSFIDRQSGAIRSFAGSTQQKNLTMYDLLRGYADPGQFYQKAKDDLYQWNVQVKRDPGDKPVSATSDTWKFTWH
jgi:hypothetical protein